MPKHILVFWWLRAFIYFFPDLACKLVEFSWSVPLGLVFFRKGISLALRSYDMQQFRSWYSLQVVECVNELRDIMPVDRTEVPDLQLLE